VSVTDKKGIVCIVGDNLRNSPGLAVKMLTPVSDVNINMISQGASEINLSFVIDEEHLDEVVVRLHDVLFASAGSFPEVFE
jgi:aspartate kinase